LSSRAGPVRHETTRTPSSDWGLDPLGVLGYSFFYTVLEGRPGMGNRQIQLHVYVRDITTGGQSLLSDTTGPSRYPGSAEYLGTFR
jgi:hypothetical protein